MVTAVPWWLAAFREQVKADVAHALAYDTPFSYESRSTSSGGFQFTIFTGPLRGRVGRAPTLTAAVLAALDEPVQNGDLFKQGDPS